MVIFSLIFVYFAIGCIVAVWLKEDGDSLLDILFMVVLFPVIISMILKEARPMK